MEIKEDHNIFSSVKEEIDNIRKSLPDFQGLNDAEIEVAIKMNLIDPDQAWWWREFWQKGERKVERDISQNNAISFKNMNEFIEYLSRKQVSIMFINFLMIRKLTEKQ
jgi:hypothetical protein